MSSADVEQTRRRVKAWLRDSEQLPPMPVAIQKAMGLLDDRASSASDIARVISRDEAITARLLRVINSAFYGLPRRISSVRHAVTLLGFEQVRLLLLGISLFETGSVQKPRAAANRELVWRHSFSCAMWAQAIARHSRYDPVEEAFIAGLLHDVGKVVLGVSVPQEFANSVEFAKKKGMDSRDAEQELLGIDHTQTGTVLSKRWNFPLPFHCCIAEHHNSCPTVAGESEAEEKRIRRLLAIVRVADSASRLLGAEATPNELLSEGKDNQFDPETISQLIQRVDALLGGSTAIPTATHSQVSRHAGE